MESSKKNTKEYNAKYYAETKAVQKLKRLEQVECKLCGRFVTYQNLPKHQKYSICKNNRLPIQQCINYDDVIEYIKHKKELEQLMN